MAVVVRGKATHEGKMLAEWVPEIVDELVRSFDPIQVILFGSVARGEDGPDSDIDLLVVLPSLDYTQRRRLMADMRRAIRVPIAIDVYPTDPRECERRRDVIGSMHYWPLREGKVVYERAA